MKEGTESPLPIYRPFPAFEKLDTKPTIFETDIKVVDILVPYRREREGK